MHNVIPTVASQQPLLQPPSGPTPVAETKASSGTKSGAGLGGAAYPPVRSRALRRNWLKIATLLVGLLICGIIYYRTTYVSGLELNSHTWEQRVFSFRRDPFTGWQLGAVRYNVPVRIDMGGTIENPRAKKMGSSILKYFGEQPDDPLRWDLVRLDDSPLPGARASILVDLLDARDHQQQPLWARWTARHPQRAAVLWPAAQRLVAADQYTWLPRLFELALLENSPDEFSNLVGHLVTAALDAQHEILPQPHSPAGPSPSAQNGQP